MLTKINFSILYVLNWQRFKKTTIIKRQDQDGKVRRY